MLSKKLNNTKAPFVKNDEAPVADFANQRPFTLNKSEYLNSDQALRDASALPNLPHDSLTQEAEPASLMTTSCNFPAHKKMMKLKEPLQPPKFSP